jgi:hypothetical protein
MLYKGYKMKHNGNKFFLPHVYLSLRAVLARGIYRKKGQKEEQIY